MWKSKNECCHSNPHPINYISSIYFFHQISFFWDTDPFLHPYPKFSALPNLNFLTWKIQKLELPKILPWTLSPSQIEPKSSKDPKLILVLTMKLLYKYIWLTLPTGALIWVALIWVTFPVLQIINHTTFIKSPRKDWTFCASKMCLSFSWQIEKFSCWSWKHIMWEYLWSNRVSLMYICKIFATDVNKNSMQLARQICHCVADWAWSIKSLWSGSLWR